MDLNNLDCPQYVNFKAEFYNVQDSFTDAESSSTSLKVDNGSESMDFEDEEANSYYSQDISCSESNLPTESCLPVSNCQENANESEYLAEDFPINRPNLSLPEKGKKNAKINKTETKPFHLTESKKRKREDQYIPLAEQIAAFCKKTPKRFHTTGPKAFEPLEHWSPPVICPKSPNLQASKRIRGVNVLSREEQEAKEAEEMKRYKFHAQPIKCKKVSQLPKVGKKLPTRPKSLQLRTAQRAAEIHGKKKQEEKPFDVEFHARPVPKSIFKGPTGLKEKPPLSSTEPKTPNFALKKRAEKWKNDNKLNESAPGIQTFKALPAPAPVQPFVVKHDKKRTEIQPFSFDIKDKLRMAKKAEKIAEEIEKENRVYEFKAKPMPSPAPCALPAVPKKPPTHPQPFNFCSDGLSSKYSSFNLSDQVCPSFKAQPATVLEKAPFIPEKSLKLPVEIKEFHLHTDIRAVERQKLKEINDIKEHEKELALQRLREIQEEEERREIMKIRKEAVHKANPIRHFKPVEIKPSSKPPTQPISPKFHTDERLSKHLE